MGRAKDPIAEAMNSFGINTVVGMLAKAERELERMESAPDPSSKRDAAINCALTIWHLNDWLWVASKRFKNNPEFMREMGVSGRSVVDVDIPAWVERNCPDIVYCQAVATGSKHVRFNDRNTTDTFFHDGPDGAMMWDSGPLLILGVEERREAAEVYRNCINFWRSLDRDYIVTY